MTQKKSILLIFAILFCINIIPAPARALTFAEYIYNNAKTNNLNPIKRFLNRGYNIDAPTPSGKTALCLALEKKDIETYEIIKSLGANDSHPCTKKISTANTKSFENKQIYVEQQPLKTSSPITEKQSDAKKSSQFISDNDSNNKYYIGAGLLLAGGAALALSGDSGGSSHKSTTTNKPTDGDDNNTPPSDDNNDNPPSDGNDDDTPAEIPCEEGFEYQNGQCVPIDNGDNTPAEIPCEEGFERLNGECVPMNAATGCLEGEKLVDGKCEAITCPSGYHLVGNSCIEDESQSEELEETDKGNASSTNINKDNQDSNEDIFGIFTTKGDVYNLLSEYTHPDNYKEINIINNGYGRVIGVYGEAQVSNAYVDGYDDKEKGEYNTIPEATGKITIINHGEGSVYGLYSKILDAQNGIEAQNSYARDEGIAHGEINILNDGGSNTYGVFGDDRAYNAGSRNLGMSYGDINIKANGNITGLGAYLAAMNATSYQWDSGKYSLANINIESFGDGNIYGINIRKDDKEIDNEIMQWFAINAGAGGQIETTEEGDEYRNFAPKEDDVKGNINIKNSGNGNVYGMYGGQRLYNAMDYGWEAANSNITANINILNHGNGEVYGMYMPFADLYGQITNDSFDGSVLRQDGTFSKVRSTINLTNTGNGITTGMRGSQFNYIRNSGTININNLGSGTAIGIYGERHSYIENSGEINIYRQAYTDPDTGNTYTPSTQTGGTAYGIYGESFATIYNSGTITIENASSGAGIYLEEDATFINENGTVIFNGEEQTETKGEALNIYGTSSSDDTAITSIMDFDNMGKGEVLLGKNGSFKADTIKGNIGVSNTVVTGSFDDIYIVNQALNASNIEKATPYSKSAMFDAYVKNYDVVLERKNFNQLLDNKSLANYLETNYSDKNNLNLYDDLKNISTEDELNRFANNLSANDIFPTFRRQNALIQKNISHTFDENLFNTPNQNYIAGFKYIDISNDSTSTLEESDGTAQTAYGLLKNKTSQGLTYGIGANISKLKTDYDNNSKRTANQLGLWLPFGYDYNNGLKWYSKLYAGYSDSSYDRKTAYDTKSADYDEYQFGIDNEVRYNIELGNNFTFQPLAELNLQHFYQEEIKEKQGQYSLKIDSSDQTSLELGLGAYFKKEHTFDTSHSLSVQIGGIYYVEFLEPDEDIKASINGMNGKFSIKNKTDTSSANLSLKANYNYHALTLSVALEKELNNDKSLLIDTGLQYNF